MNGVWLVRGERGGSYGRFKPSAYLPRFTKRVGETHAWLAPSCPAKWLIRPFLLSQALGCFEVHAGHESVQVRQPNGQKLRPRAWLMVTRAIKHATCNLSSLFFCLKKRTKSNSNRSPIYKKLMFRGSMGKKRLQQIQ